MRYIAITEISPISIKLEPSKALTAEEFNNIKNAMAFAPINLNEQKNELLKNYTEIRISEETFNFINSVANISSPLFGEKDYTINGLKFQIYTEDEYNKKF